MGFLKPNTENHIEEKGDLEASSGKPIENSIKAAIEIKL